MRFFRRIAGFLGFARDDAHEVKDQENDHQSDNETTGNRPVFQETGLPRRGFSVPIQVAVDRSQPGPVILPSASGDGGVQGLKWYAKQQRIDEDGDVADEFLDEVLQETSGAASEENEQKPYPKFEVNYSTRRAKVKTQVMSHDGKIQQCVEYQGRLKWERDDYALELALGDE